jgi:hypothetical protein
VAKGKVSGSRFLVVAKLLNQALPFLDQEHGPKTAHRPKFYDFAHDGPWKVRAKPGPAKGKNPISFALVSGDN